MSLRSGGIPGGIKVKGKTENPTKSKHYEYFSMDVASTISVTERPPFGEAFLFSDENFLSAQ